MTDFGVSVRPFANKERSAGATTPTRFSSDATCFTLSPGERVGVRASVMTKLDQVHLRKISFSCLVVFSKSLSNESQSGFSVFSRSDQLREKTLNPDWDSLLNDLENTNKQLNEIFLR